MLDSIIADWLGINLLAVEPMIVIGPGRVILTGFLAMDWVSCLSLETQGSGSLLEIWKM